MKANEPDIKSFDKSLSRIKQTISTQKFLLESPESLWDGSILKYLPEEKTLMLSKLKAHVQTNYAKCKFFYFFVEQRLQETLFFEIKEVILLI